MKIKDNLLDDPTFKKIQTTLTRFDFPWFFNDHKVIKKSSPLSTENLNYQFVHNFYNTNRIVSHYFDCIYPIIEKINPNELIRIKANMTLFWINNNENYGYHVDQDFQCKVGIFYINTNNGYTIFKNQLKVESVENRLLTFDNNTDNVHTGTTCSNQKFRITLNINYN